MFTYYCAQGNALEIEFMRAHQFRRLMEDAQLSGDRLLDTAQLNVIYSRETRGRRSSSGE